MPEAKPYLVPWIKALERVIRHAPPDGPPSVRDILDLHSLSPLCEPDLYYETMMHAFDAWREAGRADG